MINSSADIKKNYIKWKENFKLYTYVNSSKMNREETVRKHSEVIKMFASEGKISDGSIVPSIFILFFMIY